MCVCLFVCFFVCLFVCLFVGLFVCLFYFVCFFFFCLVFVFSGFCIRVYFVVFFLFFDDVYILVVCFFLGSSFLVHVVFLFFIFLKIKKFQTFSKKDEILDFRFSDSAVSAHSAVVGKTIVCLSIYSA